MGQTTISVAALDIGPTGRRIAAIDGLALQWRQFSKGLRTSKCQVRQIQQLCKEMKMKWMLAGLVLIGVGGCAHVPQSIQIQEGEIDGYRSVALRALNSPEAWRQHQQLMTFVERPVDANRKTWFDIQPGNPPIVTVWVPTVETNRINPFVVFRFDHSTHTLKGIALGSINH
jgi:hypothetical protein